MSGGDRKVPVTKLSGKRDQQDNDIEKNELFAKFAERLNVGIAATDEAGRIIFWNRKLEQLTGLGAGEALGMFVWDAQMRLMSGDANAELSDELLKRSLLDFLATGRSDVYGQAEEFEFLHPDGRKLTLNRRMVAVPTENGNSLFSMLEDVSDRQLSAEGLAASEKRFRSIIEQANDAIAIFDHHEVVLEWNIGAERLSGLKREDVIGKHLSDIVPEIFHEQEWIKLDDSFSVHEIMVRNLDRMLRTDASHSMDACLPGETDQDRQWIQAVTFPIRVGSLKLFGSIARDITLVKQTEARLQRYAHQLESLRQAGLEIAAELGLDSLVWMIAPRAIEMLNGAAMALYLYNPEKDELELAISLGENQPQLEKSARRGEKLAGHVWETGKALLLDDYHTGRTQELERKFWGKVAGAPIVWGKEFLGVLFVFSDQAFSETDLKILELFTAHAAAAIRNARLHQQLSQLAITDSLTGIFNRRHFFELAEAEFQDALRYDRSFSVLMFDLDLFKQVNDTYGHSRGDDILRTVVQRCAGTVRHSDILGRYGGEEFVVALPQANPKKALSMADRLRHVISANPIETGHGSLTITVSFGVSTLSLDDKDLMQLLNRADAALYQAKQSGRNRVCVWSDNLNSFLSDMAVAKSLDN